MLDAAEEGEWYVRWMEADVLLLCTEILSVSFPVQTPLLLLFVLDPRVPCATGDGHCDAKGICTRDAQVEDRHREKDGENLLDVR